MDRADSTALGYAGVDFRATQRLETTPATRFTFVKSAMADLSAADQVLFEAFGQGPAAEPAFARIHHGFEAWAAAIPDSFAVEHLGESITYGALDHQADRLAARLTELGVVPGDNVALFLKRSIPMVVGILAALKAGASYVPQDVGITPRPQLQHIAKVASVKVILTLSWLRHLIPVADGQVCVAVDEFLLSENAGEPPPASMWAGRATPNRDDACFVIFTSGTTGTPNGVRVTHRNVCNILLTDPGSLAIRPGVRVAQILNIAFDMAAWEILGCLANGGTLIIRGDRIAPTAREADVIISTPTILGSLDPEACRNVKVVAVAGEPCSKALADRWAAFATFYNSCGPTETTIVNTAQRYDPFVGRLTIGKPTPNNTVYVLNTDRKPCAIGEVGEMWAGGECVSAGYIGNDRLNAERYAPDPFLGHGRLMFRTRDLGRWTEDGELEHLGRVDDQVKIRGFRVELDSVSSVLETTPSCVRAVTLKYDDSDLVAFVCPATVDTDAARQAVAEALPYYYVPLMIVALDEFPATGRGKIDKNALFRIVQAGLADGHRQHEVLETVS